MTPRLSQNTFPTPVTWTAHNTLVSLGQLEGLFFLCASDPPSPLLLSWANPKTDIPINGVHSPESSQVTAAI